MNKRKRVAWEKHRKTAKKLRDKKRAEKAGAAPTGRGAAAAATTS